MIDKLVLYYSSSICANCISIDMTTIKRSLSTLCLYSWWSSRFYCNLCNGAKKTIWKRCLCCTWFAPGITELLSTTPKRVIRLLAYSERQEVNCILAADLPRGFYVILLCKFECLFLQ